jgi:nitric oxide reductase NorE protein
LDRKPKFEPSDATTTPVERHLPGEAGIWILIFGDMLMFSLMFGVFLFYRRADLTLFESSQAHLNQTFGLINTFLMLTSSWFVAMAVQAARAHRTRATVVLLRLGIACGIGFSMIKVAEYTQKIRAGIVLNSNDFYMYYYVFTGIHFVHVLIGMGVLAFIAQYASDGNFSNRKIGHIESGASFWHLVDLLWIALFALLYLLR